MVAEPAVVRAGTFRRPADGQEGAAAMDALGDDDPALSDSIRGGDGKPVALSTVVLRGALMLTLSALGLSACAPEVVRRPTQLIPEQSGSTIEIVETVSVSVGPGYSREIRRGSVWAKIGRSVEGEIFSPVDSVFTVEGAHIHEAHLVLDGERLVGFYLPVERALDCPSEGGSHDD